MSLFKKKPTLDEILSGIDQLSDKDKEKVYAKMQDLYKAEDEGEVDEIEEDKASDPETEDEKREEGAEESEEIGEDVDEVEEEVEDHSDVDGEEKADEAEEAEEADQPEDVDTGAEDGAEDSPAEETPDSGGLGEVIKKMIADTIREEVAKAFAELNKPAKEETEPHEADEDDRANLAAVEALYNS